jgi:SpoVK/Ycf46/Vps4 family AAA+-type ATPase
MPQSNCNSLDEVAARIEPAADWVHLVLPDLQLGLLRQIAAHVRNADRVYDEWGFGGDTGRCRGITAMFAGPSGTGKTMAAQVLARELSLNLYRIDLSSVVSKYIGETEKNLRRVFAAAESGGVILLFDEADALFGKRSEVKDAHVRYANFEVSYLLQRMEAYRGLAILTTNLRNAIDSAFLRRFGFVVDFPFPDLESRQRIWDGVFPATAPRGDLDSRMLARLEVAGGSIRNIALNAAFLAADEEAPVSMRHLLEAARTECVKLERPLSAAEIEVWADRGRQGPTR